MTEALRHERQLLAGAAKHLPLRTILDDWPYDRTAFFDRMTEGHADGKGRCVVISEQGKDDVVPISIPAAVSQLETEDERVAAYAESAWRQAHYWGRPERSTERWIALLRIAAQFNPKGTQ